jgi:hypothetical protein
MSAHSLFELPTASERRKVIKNLWKKTNDFLVIVEHGTTAGFKVILEARHVINEVNTLSFNPSTTKPWLSSVYCESFWHLTELDLHNMYIHQKGLKM